MLRGQYIYYVKIAASAGYGKSGISIFERDSAISERLKEGSFISFVNYQQHFCIQDLSEKS